MIRGLYRRARSLAPNGEEAAARAETFGKSAYVTACLIGEAKQERANLRRWITCFDKSTTPEEAD
jgi:hypothetical protein